MTAGVAAFLVGLALGLGMLWATSRVKRSVGRFLDGLSDQ